jgi:crotonobetainyl-CoA:carnitine CoA-transferase CaiB-like acyl-CoA transferase
MQFDLALADCTLASLVNVAQGTLLTGQRPRRWGNAHPQIVPYETFATADGHLVLAVGADRQWQRFCQAVGLPDLAIDPRFATNPARVENRDALIPQLQRLFAERTTAAWQALLTAAEVPHSPVCSLDEVIESPQVAAREMVLETEDSQGRAYRLLGGAIHWYDEPPRTAPTVPNLGEHTDEVLRDWLGYSHDDIAKRRAAGVLG